MSSSSARPGTRPSLTVRLVGELRAALSAVGLRTDRGAWVREGEVLACGFPRTEAAVALLARQGITLLVNLHERRRHPPERLAHYGMTEIHLPVPDFAAPTPETLDAGVAAIQTAVAAGKRVAVHCGGGLGRTGTLAACYLLALDPNLGPEQAIAAVRAVRPGAVETAEQAAAVAAYAARRSGEG